jgi:predicted RNase H-like nuclease (RuvC/YqgF family)
MIMSRSKPSNIALARETAKRLSRKLAVDVEINYAYGAPRAESHNGSRDFSPRCAPKELYRWLDACEQGVDMMAEHARQLEASRREALRDAILDKFEGIDFSTSEIADKVNQAFAEQDAQDGGPVESYQQTIARLEKELQNARESRNSLARELERLRDGLAQTEGAS